MGISYQHYIDGMDAQAEIEEMRSESAESKLSRMSSLYSEWQVKIAEWEIVDREEDKVYELYNDVGHDQRRREYKVWQACQAKTRIAALACEIAKGKLLEYIAHVA